MRTLIKADQKYRPGFYHTRWDGTDERGRLVASGPYVYQLSTKGFGKSRIMIMLK